MGARLPGEVRLAIYEDMAAAEPLWRAFERQADGTVFQSYQWLAAWQRHVGARQEVRPAIVVAQDASGAPFALFALAVRRARFARELIWLGSELCDYNGAAARARLCRALRRRPLPHALGRYRTRVCRRIRVWATT